MKNTIKLFGIIALVALIGFSMAGCKNDPSSETETYTGTANGEDYTLKITQARYVAQKDDNYELTVGAKTSRGIVASVTATLELTLQPSSAGAGTFTVTVNVNSSSITKITGIITFTDGNTQEGPGDITPSAPPSIGGDGSLGSTLTITDAQVYEWDEVQHEQTESSKTITLTHVISLDSLRPDESKPMSTITEVINIPATVTVTGGKLTVSLGAPKELFSMDTMAGSLGLTVSPAGAKIYGIYGFSDKASWADNPTIVSQSAESLIDDLPVFYYYTDRNVNVTGTYIDEISGGYSVTVAMNLKAGWNSVILKEYGDNSIILLTEKPSQNFIWVLWNE